MSKPEIFTTNPIKLTATSFYPRNYNPDFLFVKDGLLSCPTMLDYISGEIKGGSTPPAYLFMQPGEGVQFIKTSAVTRHYINVNDLQWIQEDFHKKTIKRSITKPYDIIYTMTGKFMGKAAMCPSTIPEMNMSQNSVVLHTRTPEEAAFLTIFLNSHINRIQVRGTYSITKQKFMNQGKIAALKVVSYDLKYDNLMKEYIAAFDRYYLAVKEIQDLIKMFDSNEKLSFSDTAQYGFTVKPNSFTKTMLTPNFYREDIEQTLISVQESFSTVSFDADGLSKGNEIGSANYLEEGIPFIKTSDIINFDVDYEPDCYCSESYLSELHQEIKKGDIIFAKDGKPGEVAIIQEDNSVVISSGLVKYHPRNNDERYWVFLLLTSLYGSAYFKKWFVIASTMLHLRSDFFSSFQIPEITDETKAQYLTPLENAFETKHEAYKTIRSIRKVVEASFVNTDIKLEI